MQTESRKKSNLKFPTSVLMLEP